MRLILLRLLLIAAIAALVMGTAFCGGDPEDLEPIKQHRELQQKQAGDAAKSKRADQDEEEYASEDDGSQEDAEGGFDPEMIRSITISKEDLAKDGVVKVLVDTKEPFKRNQRVTFTYWKNKLMMLENTESDTYKPPDLKSGDYVHADVMIHHNDVLVLKKRTDSIEITNSPPVFNDVKFPDVRGVGDYQITVTAQDPDGDSLTFSLDNPNTEIAMSIDPSTGTINCTLTADTPESFSFDVTVKDGKGGETKRTLTMRFFKPPATEE